MVSSGKPCLFVGESGTAKSVTIANYLAHLDPSTNIVLNVNFSSRTSSLDVQRAIEDSTEKRTKVSTTITTTAAAHSFPPGSSSSWH